MLASVRQEDLGKLRVGQTAYVTLPGQEGLRFAGKITNLGQQFDPETRVMQVRIELANANGTACGRRCWRTRKFRWASGKPALLVSFRCRAADQRPGCRLRADRAGPFAVRPVQRRRNRGRQDSGARRAQGWRAGRVRGSFILKSQLLKSTLESE